MSALPAFVVLTTQKSPVPARRHAATNGSTESLPRYGLTVSASCRRTDVAALAVGDDEEPGRPGVLAHLFERAEPVRSESLEERKLGFHAYDIRRHRVDESGAEARAGLGRRLPAQVRFAA